MTNPGEISPPFRYERSGLGSPSPVRLLPASQAAYFWRETMNLIKEVKAAWVQREIKRLMPAVSHKAEPIEQRRNPARAARKAAKKA